MLIYVGYYMQNMVEPAESAIQNHVLRDNEPTLSGQQALLRKDAFKRARICLNLFKYGNFYPKQFYQTSL